MARGERVPRKGTVPFLVSGPAPGFPNGVREWTSALNEAQAKKQVAKLLEQRHPDIRIYLGDCKVTRGAPNKKAPRL